MQKTVLQNRMAYVLTAAQGVTSTLIKTKCCVYIPDDHRNISGFLTDMSTTWDDSSQEETGPVWDLDATAVRLTCAPLWVRKRHTPLLPPVPFHHPPLGTDPSRNLFPGLLLLLEILYKIPQFSGRKSDGILQRNRKMHAYP